MRFLAPTAAALTALTLLAGCSSAGSSDEPLESSTQAQASTSASSKSKSPKPSPKPTGAQVVQIGGPDSKDTKETARKEAFEAVKQYARIQSAWGTHKDGIDNFSEEDLKKFLDGDALKQMQEAHQGLVKNVEQGEKPGKGQIEVRLLDMDNAGKIDFGNGKTWEHGSVQLQICEDWSSIRNMDGSKAFSDDKAKRKMLASVTRGEDGYYYLTSYRVDHYGCD